MTLKRPTTESPEFNRITQAIIKQVEAQAKSMRTSELMRLSKKVEQLGIRSRRFTAKLYEELINSWEDLSFFERIDCLNVFVRQGIDISQDLSKLLDTISENISAGLFR
jgi:hypothetical protein